MRKNQKIMIGGGIGIVLILACVAVALFVTSGQQQAAQTKPGLPDWTDEAAVRKEARALIDEANDHDWDALAGKVSATVKTSKSELIKGFKNSEATMDAFGAFKSYDDVAYYQSASGDQAIIVQQATHENAKVQYSVAFEKDGGWSMFRFK
ncbi:hypothetical protein Corgl_0896 [Coriobacterium glomerans PW2]|uniref:DUF3887 domain-containing protein n=1 Tax=Coriobacterium glomerans (strain ATCC 49209 / DSM 20642 / JCM 10262 / PW2) TaxID=700015 RepID=F2N9H9_CORGP|nr:DUF3887 domain-containing protein [Coriobacterium glomerans]AEB07008.1 hypothetical protein Corgl_0896 [Coriobacterium glomerans PW2]